MSSKRTRYEELLDRHFSRKKPRHDPRSTPSNAGSSSGDSTHMPPTPSTSSSWNNPHSSESSHTVDDLVDPSLSQHSHQIRHSETLEKYSATVIANALLDSHGSGQCRDSEAASTAILEEIINKAVESVSHSHPFGDPTLTNRATLSAVVQAHNLRDELHHQLQLLENLRPPLSESYVQKTLEEVETSYAAIMEEISSIKRPAAAWAVQEGRQIGLLVDRTLVEQRSLFPNTRPFRINNESAFAIPSEGRNDVALLAYVVALVQRVFCGTGTNVASFTLRTLKVFAKALIALGNPSPQQENVIKDIPDTIETVERRLNLDVPTIPYAICTRCSFAHKPTFPHGANSTPVYPSQCSFRRALYEEQCNSPLLLPGGQPMKTSEYYSFLQWFGRFVTLPGIEAYADKFCEEIDETPETPLNKSRTSDGRFYREFQDADGKSFVMDRGSEGRWFFMLHADFFNVEGNNRRGAHASTGVISITCLNLPLDMRHDSSFVFIPCIVQGPHEPDSTEAEHQHILRPIIEEFLIAYEQGVCFHSTHDSNHTQSAPYSRTHRVCLAGVIMDLKASRPYCGLPDINTRVWCIYCGVWHTFNYMRTDCEEFGYGDDDRLRMGAQEWQNAASLTMRKQSLNLYGTRTSEFWRLPYWRPTQQVTIDPMHLMFLILQQRFFRDPSALGLEINKNNKFTPPPEAEIAFRYPFTPFPPLSALGSTPPPNASPLWQLACTMNYVSAVDVGNNQRYLCQPLHNDTAGIQLLSKRLTNSTRQGLKYACIDLDCLPSNLPDNPAKHLFVDTLIKWRLKQPLQPLKRVPVNQSLTLERIQQTIQQVIVPAWVDKPPPSIGHAQAGSIKADHWRTMFSLYLPLALISLWSLDSPIKSCDAATMKSALDTAMHLSCASIMMTKSNLTESRRRQFRYSIHQHISGLKENFPAFQLPSHHLSFHLDLFMDLFSNVRNWWCFQGELLILKLRGIPINHRVGEFEGTLLRSFNKGSLLRQWLTRPDCPQPLKSCQKLLNMVFRSVLDVQGHSDDEPTEPAHENLITKTPADLEYLLGPVTDVHFIVRLNAARGYYAIPSAPGAGNSYISFFPCGDRNSEWVAGRIQYIFQRNEKTYLVVQQSESFDVRSDPFRMYWNHGFEAKTVSTKFCGQYILLEEGWVCGHTARWQLNNDGVVVVSLAQD